MSRLSPELRNECVKIRKKGYNKSFIAKIFGTTRQTISSWCKRAHHAGREFFKDKPRKPKESKIKVETEATILGFRNFFKWGTARIQQGLASLPDYAKEVFPTLVQGVNLSRTAINNVLKKHKLNGYHKRPKEWKFFRAQEPDELWQIDLKGPYILQGKKYWFLAVIDDYSRYLVLTTYFEHTPTTKEITDLLDKLLFKPKKILADNGSQFRKLWKTWCRECGIEPISAHPYYPQDKGKVERVIRTISEEFIYILKKVPEWLSKLADYTLWYNTKRFHRGIKATPNGLYHKV